MRSQAGSLLVAFAVSLLASSSLADPEPATEYVLPMNVVIDRDVARNFSPSNLETLFADGPTRAWEVGIQGTLPTRGAHCPLRYELGDVRIIETQPSDNFEGNRSRLYGFENQRIGSYFAIYIIDVLIHPMNLLTYFATILGHERSHETFGDHCWYTGVGCGSYQAPTGVQACAALTEGFPDPQGLYPPIGVSRATPNGVANCLDQERNAQGTLEYTPVPQWTACRDGSGYCDGAGSCVAADSDCFTASGPAPAGTSCGGALQCGVCTGDGAACVPCYAPRAPTLGTLEADAAE
jgi:hypothetical protein